MARRAMLTQFFFSHSLRIRCWAWAGLVLILAHSFLRVYIKKLFNAWYGEFYDIAGKSSSVLDDDSAGLEEGRQQVAAKLLEFSLLCLPALLIHPVFKYVTNRWVLSWRLAIVDGYLEVWSGAAADVAVENAAQRIHEARPPRALTRAPPRALTRALARRTPNVSRGALRSVWSLH